ncbi:MAG: hypothetical protein JXQ72_12335 [Anaerolineae bacterium]|nr:hypothetical protein [Anaerolineae bacterium]
MSSLPLDDSHPWVKQIQDAIADNSGLREGLDDADALPLVEWGRACARPVAAQLAAQSPVSFAAPGSPDPNTEKVDETAYTLTRLMTRINWVVTYRAKKDPVWLARTFQMINKLSQDLFGDDALVLADDEIKTWIDEQAGRSSGDLIRDLIARLTPATLKPAAPDSPLSSVLPDTAASAAPEPPPAPFGSASLPGRQKTKPAESSSSPGQEKPASLPGREKPRRRGLFRLPGRDKQDAPDDET